jgi:hypothetical protein
MFSEIFLSKVVLRFEFFDTVNIKIVVFWFMMSCVVGRCQHFGGMCCCVLHGGMYWHSCLTFRDRVYYA